ncbi:MAG: transcription-repair coupling factor [Proteobacteria bacterium]|nr:transcription-repair coupling factor [Cystobacterineae bacterium]MCL2258849.1 transcription-repair coupling factor [Cystobacterineae bacterium]MCL2314845.1 transcription-repair coupling factor [Pseudomonadota bacterium]
MSFDNNLALLQQAISCQQTVHLSGLRGASRGLLLSQLCKTTQKPLLCITADEASAEQLTEDIAFFFGGTGTLAEPRILKYPAATQQPWDAVIFDAQTMANRLSVLFHLSQKTAGQIIVASLPALAKRLMPVQQMNLSAELLAPGQEYARDTLARKLAHSGYRFSPLVEEVGHFSVRGDILDVFPPMSEWPFRLEYFGDYIESIRSFEPDTQKTIENTNILHLLPACEWMYSPSHQAQAQTSLRILAETVNLPTSKLKERFLEVEQENFGAGMESLLPAFYAEPLHTFFDYLAAGDLQPILFSNAPEEQERSLLEFYADMERSYQAALEREELSFPPSALFLEYDKLKTLLQQMPHLSGGGLTLENASHILHFSLSPTQTLRESIRAHHGEESALTPLIEQLSTWRDMRLHTLIACGTLGQADRLARLLGERNIRVDISQIPLDLEKLSFEPKSLAKIFIGEISAGFVAEDKQLALLSDEDIFGARARRKPRRKHNELGFAQNLGDLKEGDLVVHTDFGVARYTGMTKMLLHNVENDFLVLEYAGKDKVYLPVSRMRLISKFSGGDPAKIVLDRLGTTGWEKTKAKVKESLLKMAAELLQMYASRQAHPGFAFSPPNRYFHQFEADFEFEETPDQTKAIEDVLGDMQKPNPMDRLICGDVGYGKTEVAMRAAFKAVLDHKQVAVLVPTTLLAHQHVQTFKKRFADYPVHIEVASSLKKPKETSEIFRRTQEGKVDILIGTHKLLSSQLDFKNLGLLIIDEEQKFGVKQKEHLKKLKTQVDVVTLSATPIPRTLNMALGGLREMSIIATPPQDRRSIRTVVTKFDTQLIREAIQRELQRGGQVYFVHNRVQSIHSVEKLLKEIVPNALIGVAHGQLGEGRLESVMLDFIQKKIQVLLCTSIIESGLDIPAANTMIVNRSDTFGLAQLYQLRGRVGRSKERAYAYLLVPARKTISKEAERRLEVLQTCSELGAGFSIASHDLELRGAGNLLGENQSGAIEAVGFELYTQMLEETVAQMQGQPLPNHMEPDIQLPVSALLPDDYIPNVHQRLVFYKRFSQAADFETLDALRLELVDRYGHPPTEVDALCALMQVKIELRELSIRALETGAGKLVFSLGTNTRIEPAKLTKLLQTSKGRYRLTPEMKLVAQLEPKELFPQTKQILADLRQCTTTPTATPQKQLTSPRRTLMS